MKPTLGVAAAAIVVLALGNPALARMLTTVGEGEGELDIIAWPGYIERGESNKIYDLVTGF